MSVCNFCCNPEAQHNLKQISDSGFNVNFKLREAFKVEIDLTKFSEICKSCDEKVEASYQFFQQVQRSIKFQESISVKHDSEVFVKIEHDDNDSNYGFSDGYSHAWTEPGTGIKEENEDFDNGGFGYSPYAFAAPFDSKNTRDKPILAEIPNPKRKKIRKNRGLRGNRQTRRYEMLDIFEQELKNQNFATKPEKLENLETDTKFWSNFDWSCIDCRETFENVLDLNAHIRKSHHKEFRGTCIQCQKESPNFAAVLNHTIKNHHKNLKFCCIICSKYHESFLDLYNHQLKYHKTYKTFICLYCGIHFISGSHAKHHMILTHKRIDPNLANKPRFECDACGEKMLLKEQMRNHLSRHHRKYSFPCSDCHRTFSIPADLAMHKTAAHSTNPQLCIECGKLFGSVHRLKAHFRNVHSTDKNLSCEFCDFKTNQMHSLKKHMRRHDDGAGTLQCPHCPSVYKYDSGLLYHIRRVHTGEQPYRCPVVECQKRFYDYANGRKHIQTCHNIDGKPVKD